MIRYTTWPNPKGIQFSNHAHKSCDAANTCIIPILG